MNKQFSTQILQMFIAQHHKIFLSSRFKQFKSKGLIIYCLTHLFKTITSQLKLQLIQKKNQIKN